MKTIKALVNNYVDFPKIDSPFLREIIKGEYIVTPAINPDYQWVFDEIPVAVAYKNGTKTLNEYPAISHEFLNCKPVYKTLKGWRVPLTGIKKYIDLPKEAKNYVRMIEDNIGVPVNYISIGPEREALLIKN